jgi:membrane associated rhomboid family serine protease
VAQQMPELVRRYWPVPCLILACILPMLAQEWFQAQEIGFRKRWAFVAGWMWFYPSAFHDDGFDWGWQRPAMLFTHGFWHLDWRHLAVNMAMLAVVGIAALRRVGPAEFLALYLTAMPAAALVYAWASGPEGSMAGASGAIHGIVGAVILWALADRQPVRAAVWAGAVLALNLWFRWLTEGNFAWQLHLAGLAAGALWVIIPALAARTRAS